MNATTDMLNAELTQWVEQGWLRRLDLAFSRFIASQDAHASAPLVLATALLAHVEGAGHSGLPLADLLDQPAGARAQLLGWTDDALAAVRSALAGALAPLPATVEAWQQALARSPAVDAGGQGTAPLVLVRGRLLLRRYWQHERQVAQQVLQRCRPAAPVEEALATPWLKQWFDVAETSGVDWQQTACALALGSRFTLITGGPGTGKTHTAARLLALRVATASDPAALRFALTAPTGKAAARLRQSIESALQSLPHAPAGLSARLPPARTLHALLGARPDTRRFTHDAANPLALDLLIVDEASMLHLEMMAALLAALPPAAHVVLLGDKDQLASVEAGSVLSDLCADAEAGRYQPDTAARLQRLTGQTLPEDMIDRCGPPLSQHTVMLRSSRRFGGAIAALAQAVQRGDAAGAVSSAGSDAAVVWRRDATPLDAVALACHGRPAGQGEVGGYGSHMTRVLAGPPPAATTAAGHARWVQEVLQAFDGMRVLCALREGDWGVSGLNAAIESELRLRGLVPARGEWYAGRPVMVLRNDPVLGVSNGDVGIVLPGFHGEAGPEPGAEWSRLRVWFAGGVGRQGTANEPAVRSLAVARLREVETAFAMTVHKSQGSEFGHVVLTLAPDAARVATREWLYTGITRARTALTLVLADDTALANAVRRVTRRSSGLGQLLQDGEAA